MDSLSDLFKAGGDTSCGPQGQFGVSSRLVPRNLLLQSGGGAAHAQQQRQQHEAAFAAQQHWAAETSMAMSAGASMGGAPAHPHADRFGPRPHGMQSTGGSLSAPQGATNQQFPHGHGAVAGHQDAAAVSSLTPQFQVKPPQHLQQVAQQMYQQRLWMQQQQQQQQQEHLWHQQMLQQHHQQQEQLLRQEQQQEQQKTAQDTREFDAVEGGTGPDVTRSTREDFWKAAQGGQQTHERKEHSGWADAVAHAMMRQRAAEQTAQQQRLQEGLIDETGADKVDTAIASGEVSRIMERSSDDRVKNSQFLKFMRGLNIGALEIQGNTVVEKTDGLGSYAEDAIGTDTPYGPGPSIHRAERSFAGDEATTASPVFKDPGPSVTGDVDVKATMQRAWEDPMAGRTATRPAQVLTSTNNAEIMAPMFVSSGVVPARELQQTASTSASDEVTELHGLPPGRPSLPKSAAVARAHELYSMGLIEAALEFCKSCLDEDAIVALVNEGDRAKTFVVMGQCYAELNEDRLAIAAFESAMELDPYVDQACLKASACYVNDGRIEDAIRVLNLWLRQDPHFMDIEYEPDVYSDGSAADEPLQKLLAANAAGGDPEMLRQIREGIGVLCSAVGDPARALEFFQQVLPAAESSRHIILNQIAACQTRLGNHALAVASYKAALALRPNYLRAWVNLGITHSNRGDFEASSRCYLRAAELNETFLTMDGRELRPQGKLKSQEHSAGDEDFRVNDDERLRSQLWSYLRITFAMMGRSDLVARSQHMRAGDFKEFLDEATEASHTPQ